MKVGIIGAYSQETLHIRNLFQQLGHSIILSDDSRNIPFLVAHHSIQVLLVCAKSISDAFIQEQLPVLEQKIPVFVSAEHYNYDVAIKALKFGATDALIQPYGKENIKQKLEQLNFCKTEQEAPPHLTILEGSSKKVKALKAIIERAAPTGASILLTGENGTGKSSIAAYIHSTSNRTGNFIAVDVNSLPKNLVESELFGHIKGAFSDAKENKEGKFKIADKGTLFLDEIANIDLQTQTKLLSVLQNRTFSPLGSNEIIQSDFRLISATNVNLKPQQLQKGFRQDLMYRINTIEIHVPALRERKEDLVDLSNAFIQRYNKKYNKQIGPVTKAVEDKLKNHHWPGNIRELEHCLERAIIFNSSNALLPEDLQFSASDATLDEPAYTGFNLKEIERLTIKRALQNYNDNISKAAGVLGITRASLYNKINKLKI